MTRTAQRARSSEDYGAMLSELYRRIYDIEQVSLSPSVSGGTGEPGDGNYPEIIIDDGFNPPAVINLTPPPVPGGLVLTTDTYFNEIFINADWDPPSVTSAVAGYNIMLQKRTSTEPEVFDLESTITVLGTSHRFRNLEPNTLYRVRVWSVNKLGIRSSTYLEGTITTTADQTIPPAVTNVSVARGATTVIVSFTPLTFEQAPDVARGAGVYLIEVHSNSTFTNLIRTMTTTANVVAFNDIGTNGVLVDVWVRVAAIDSSGNQGPWATGSLLDAGGINGPMILPDAVGADQLAPGAVTAPKLAANSVVAGKVAANAITATNIVSGSVTSERLTVAAMGDNRVVNGDFEGATRVQGPHTVPEAWGGVTAGTGLGGLASIGLGSNSFGQSVRLQPTDASSGLNIHSRTFPVVAGEVYFWSLRFLSEVTYATTGGGGFYYGFAITDTPVADPTEVIPVSGGGANWQHVIGGGGGTANVWNYAEGQYTVQASGFLTIRAYAWLIAHAIRFDDVVMRKVQTSVSIGNGTILAPNINAGAVTSDKIIAGAITTAHMDVGSIDGDRITANTLDVAKLKADSILAKNIKVGAGGQFQIGTSPGNNTNGMGAVINSQGISLFKANGDRTVYMDATTGTATFTGSVVGSNITGGTIDGVAITGGLITGTLIQTALSGTRVAIGITPNAYNAHDLRLYGTVAGTSQPSLIYRNDFAYGGSHFASLALRSGISNSAETEAVVYVESSAATQASRIHLSARDIQLGGTGGLTRMLGAAEVADALTSLSGGIVSAGPSAGFAFKDRTSSPIRYWTWYGSGDVARLNNGVSDVLSVDINGGVTVAYPSATGHAATKGYVDTGLSGKSDSGHTHAPSGGGTPSAHASTHAVTGTDPVTLAQSQITGLTDSLSDKASLSTLSNQTFSGNLLVPHIGSNSYQKADYDGPYMSMTATGIHIVNRTATTNTPLTVAGMAGQGGNLQVWRKDGPSGVQVANMTKYGALYSHTLTPYASRRHSLSQTITTENADQLILFDTAVDSPWKVGWDSVNHEFIIEVTGLYILVAEIRWDSVSSLGHRVLHIVRNRRGQDGKTPMVISDSHTTPGGADTIPSGYGVDPVTNHCMRIHHLIAGDRVSCVAEKRTSTSNPTNINLQTSTAYPHFGIAYQSFSQNFGDFDPLTASP